MSFPRWGAHVVRDQVAPSPDTATPLASPASPAESSASHSPPASWRGPRPEEPPEPLPPPVGHPLASQKPAGHYASLRLHTVTSIQICSCKTARLHPLPPPPERADRQSPPPDQTRRKHYLGCPKPLEPLRLGGSPSSLQAWSDQSHSKLHWPKSF